MTTYSNKASTKNRFRIIAGQWRSRVVRFPGTVESLRPTTDRIRETLFNWLQQKIVGARCLDLFAGSGALAFEACSRGAASVTALDSSADVINSLRDNCAMLECPTMKIVRANALQWLKAGPDEPPFDIVFIDPPYDLALIPECCTLLAENGWLTPGCIIYLESDAPLEKMPLPESFHLLRNKRAGHVNYGVCEYVID